MVPHKITGTVGVALDNKSITDDRVTDSTALRNTLYGDNKKLQHKNIIEKEEEILKDLFPDLPKDWNKHTDVYNSMNHIDELKKGDSGADGVRKMNQQLMFKRFKGEVVIVRHSPWIVSNLYKIKEEYQKKYPDLYDLTFPPLEKKE